MSTMPRLFASSMNSSTVSTLPRSDLSAQRQHLQAGLEMPRDLLKLYIYD